MNKTEVIAQHHATVLFVEKGAALTVDDVLWEARIASASSGSNGGKEDILFLCNLILHELRQIAERSVHPTN